MKSTKPKYGIYNPNRETWLCCGKRPTLFETFEEATTELIWQIQHEDIEPSCEIREFPIIKRRVTSPRQGGDLTTYGD